MTTAADLVVCDLTLTGEPVVKGRPRMGRGRTYTPAATVAAEEAIRWQLRAAGVRPVADDPLEVLLRFRCSGHRRRDIDNLCKLALDACNGFAWVDDSQVVHLDVWLERQSTRPGTDLRITRYVEGTLR
jgi:Holliday junction resolvase RusA-like endonuclease